MEIEYRAIRRQSDGFYFKQWGPTGKPMFDATCVALFPISDEADNQDYVDCCEMLQQQDRIVIECVTVIVKI